MSSSAEALAWALAVCEDHPRAGDPADPVGGALAKIVRVLPERVAAPARNVRDASGPGAADQYRPSPELTTALIESGAAARRLRLAYRMGAADRESWSGCGAALRIRRQTLCAVDLGIRQ